jgi:hypothetical protein
MLDKLIGWTKSAFSDNGSPSSSRLLTVPHSLVAMFCAIYMTIKTGGHPDGTSLLALGGFATVHYATNRITTAFGKDGNTAKSDVVASPITKV